MGCPNTGVGIWPSVSSSDLNVDSSGCTSCHFRKSKCGKWFAILWSKSSTSWTDHGSSSLGVPETTAWSWSMFKEWSWSTCNGTSRHGDIIQSCKNLNTSMNFSQLLLVDLIFQQHVVVFDRLCQLTKKSLTNFALGICKPSNYWDNGVGKSFTFSRKWWWISCFRGCRRSALLSIRGIIIQAG